MDTDFKDYMDSKTQGEVLLQLLVFEHATGGTTVQMEVGELSLKHGCTEYTFRKESVGHISKYNHASTDAFRGAIDRAVAEQFGRKPEPPYIERQQDDSENFWLIQHNRMNGIDGQCYKALCEIAGKELPVVDASESQPTSVWRQVFPPDARAFTKDWIDVPIADTWREVADHLCAQMRKETAFTVWRLTVTR